MNDDRVSTARALRVLFLILLVAGLQLQCARGCLRDFDGLPPLSKFKQRE